MDNRITLTIKSTSGELKDQFNTHQPLHALKREVMGRLHIDPSQANSYGLVYNGQELDEGKTLQELGIPDGAILLLVLKSAVVV